MPPRTLTITRPYAVGGSAPERTDRRGLHNPGQSIATAIALLGFPIAAVQLRADGPVPVDRLEVSSRRRHLDVIGARDVEGAAAADAQIGAGRADQRLGLRRIRFSEGGAGIGALSDGRSLHWSALNTVKRCPSWLRARCRASFTEVGQSWWARDP